MKIFSPLFLLVQLVTIPVFSQVPINGKVNGKTMYGIDEYKTILSKYFEELGLNDIYSENEIRSVLGVYYADQPYAACALKVQRYYSLKEVLEKSQSSSLRIYDLYELLNHSYADNPSLASLLMPAYNEQVYNQSLKDKKPYDYWDELIKETLAKCQNLYQTFERSLPQCRQLFIDELEKIRKKGGGNDFLGTWEGNTGYGTLTVTFKGSGGGMSASTVHVKNNGFTDKGGINNCQLEGNKLKCLWYEDYEDADKKIHRTGWNTISVSGDQLQISSEEDEPEFTWKPNVTQYPSGIKRGVKWNTSIKRKEN